MPSAAAHQFFSENDSLWHVVLCCLVFGKCLEVLIIVMYVYMCTIITYTCIYTRSPVYLDKMVTYNVCTQLVMLLGEEGEGEGEGDTISGIRRYYPSPSLGRPSMYKVYPLLSKQNYM